MESNELEFNQIDRWVKALFNLRYNYGMDHESMKNHFIAEYQFTGDQYNELCELVDEKLMNIRLEE
tara:strand:- start:87 stop:284 length:198 start_codon:yes stop_codon:yes gene_type:complete